ncbi:class IV adenylate cyclase [Saccharomonospora halophila]|uniref:class IV adenylate cyclase n=1 Tax=Saccharomonospora halophila TaxID=129922 RepID=UPI0003774408|nr:CYTH domain-containing protein [Saccharomonospora halophila]
MPIEHEAKILDVDPDATEKLILDTGGRNLREKFLRRYVYGIVPGDDLKWIRLRDTDGEATLTVKEISSDAIDGTHEVEVGVEDFAATNTLLGMSGFTLKFYQESRRTSFVLDGAQVEIDTWPRIPPYVEIEAASKAEAVRIASLLGYVESDLTGENTIKIYARYGIDLNAITELTF